MNAPDNTMPRDRYPGLNSFRAEEQAIFFGRQRETAELLQMVRAEQAVVLFSKSGLGKSSLLSAGLLPALRPLNFQPIRVRFQQEKNATDTADTTTPIDVLVTNLRKEFRVAYERLEQQPPEPTMLFDAASPRLWEQVKVCPFPDQRVPVFLFDQFEEFFAYTLDQQKEFASQLAELLHDQAPVRVINWLLDMDKRTPDVIAWSQQPPVKCVFAIRADRLADMHSLKPYIPLILRNRYELGPLQQQAARDAISQPAGLPQVDGPFATPPFTYHLPTLEMIMDELSNDDCEVEGAQLQIVCQYVEDRLKEKFQPVVDHEVISGRRQVMRILDKFYRTQLRSIGNSTDITAASNVLENELVEGGRRVGLPEPKMMRLLGITFSEDHKRNIIRQLQNARLIRSETTHLGATYELSHDTIIDPVVKARKLRDAWQKRHSDREEMQRKDRELKEQTEKLRLETEAKERALRAESIAQRAKEEAQQLEQEKDSQLRENLRLQVERERLLGEAQRERLRYLRLTYFSLLLLLLALGAIIYGISKGREGYRMLQMLIDTRAMAQYEQGRHGVAHRLRDEKNRSGLQTFLYSFGNSLSHINVLRFAPYAGKDIQADTNQHYVATLYSDDVLNVWKRRSDTPDSLVYQTEASAFLMAGSSVGIFRRDTAQSGYLFRVINLNTGQNALLSEIAVRNTSSVKLSGDGHYVVVTDRYSQPHLFTVKGPPSDEVCVFNETLIAPLPAELSNMFSLATFSPQHHYVLIYDSDDGRGWVFDLVRSRLVTTLQKLAGFSFSVDDRQMALVTDDGRVSLLTLQNGEQRPVSTIPEPFEYSARITFAPNGQHLLVITSHQQTDTLITSELHLFDLTKGIRQLWVRDVANYWLFESMGQLIYTRTQNPNQPLRYELPNKRLDGLPITYHVLEAGHTHVLLNLGNKIELRDLRLNTPFIGALPNQKKATSMIFYAPDGRTDTHLIALYRDYVQIIDLSTGHEERIWRGNQPFGSLTLSGNLLRVRLGERYLDRTHQNRQYWAFFINNKRNQPDSLRRYVYPELTPRQRKEFGLLK